MPEDIGVVHSLLRDAAPWVTFLPEADVDVFITELVTVARRAVELGNPGPIAVLLTQWRHSAEVYADPALLETLTAAPEGDLGSVSAPSGQVSMAKLSCRSKCARRWPARRGRRPAALSCPRRIISAATAASRSVRQGPAAGSSANRHSDIMLSHIRATMKEGSCRFPGS